jgi:SAM-dependent methyltransferase
MNEWVAFGIVALICGLLAVLVRWAGGDEESPLVLREPDHDPAAATRWFDHWHVYRSIVDHDWMCHRGIFAAARQWVLLRHPGPFTLLDAGCGDAGFIRPSFTTTGLWSYTGVDASAAALDKARAELTGAPFEVRLVEADLLAFLAPGAAADAPTFDVILASYAVHHLPAREKEAFFARAHSRLAPDGSLLFADIFRRDGESRAAYLDAYVGMMRSQWHGLSADALAGTCAHVIERDYPETAESLAALAAAGGFRATPRELFRDATGFHRLLVFTMQPTR